ncbi:presequence protease, mitochondrial [Bacillus rossius redtenbacheri]|uniref:presequence protease, mitochondrial n=1 Tax=Bacillus rossius redtenbacheri TaxID=93214 RepID=UPI002FDCD0A1
MLRINRLLPSARKTSRNGVCRRHRNRKLSSVAPSVAASRGVPREGEELEGFIVRQVAAVPEFRLRAYRLLHEASGAQYLHVGRDDGNNAFSVGFRTTPGDSTGLPHILEHTTLCGSARYPCRDPFFKMLQRSLATFMNAMTGPDYTMYPFATQNERDYRNLMSVYLDAVFRPQLRESDFRQEGWRLEHENVEDKNSPIVIKGVVFNEMKGVFADNQNIFQQSFLNEILPSHTYQYVSGGHPLSIPKLSYEDLTNFHTKYYNPSNARFFSYGNFPIADHLNFISNNYLRTCESLTPDIAKETVVPPERRWSSPRRKHVACRLDPMVADRDKQSTVAVGLLCSDITDIQGTFEMQVLSELLVKGPNSAFYKSLVEPNIGAGFAPVTGYDAQTKDTMFAVGLQGISASDFGTVVEIFDNTVDSVISKGFDEKQVEGVLHNIELSMKHQVSDFGLGLLFNLTPLWNHDGDLVTALRVEDQVSQLRQNLKRNPHYLQDKVKLYLCDNTHRLVLTMSPDESYEANLMQAEEQLLKDKLSSLTEEDKNKIYVQGIELKKEQERAVDTSCLPTLQVGDLKQIIDATPVKHLKFASVPVQVCAQPTNGVSYFRGILNSSNLNDELKALVPLFCYVATKMGTRRHDYRELDSLVQLKTGGLNLSSHVAEDTRDLGLYEEGVIFSSHSLDRNTKDMFDLWSEIFREVTLDDVKRFDMLVKVLAANLGNGVVSTGHMYAVSSAASLISPAALRKELSSGLSYVAKVRDIAQMLDPTPVLKQVKSISESLLNKRRLRCAVNFDGADESRVLSEVESLVGALPGSCDRPFVQTRAATPTNGADAPATHHVLPIPVNYAAKCTAAVPFSHEHFAPLRVLARLLSARYLHPLVREQGGAYGSGASVSPAGVFSFFSYRDPHSCSTLDAFDAAPDWVSADRFTEQDVREAKLGVFQQVDAPVAPGSRGMLAFLQGVDDELLQRHRAALMAVRREDLHLVSGRYLGRAGGARSSRALLGPRNERLAARPGEAWRVVQQE